MKKRFEVVRDLQGGCFGFGLEYTADEWLEQARDWCQADDNEELDNCFENIQKNRSDWSDEDIIEEIASTWDLELEEI